MKKLGLILAALATTLAIAFAITTTAHAQQPGAEGIDGVRWSLSRADSLSGARIEVVETPDAARALELLMPPQNTVYYGVSLFRDNSQSARENARAVAARFADMFPDIPVAVSYESPYFKVTAGSFPDRVDAIALCGRVLPQFSKAVVVQQ